MDVAEVRGAQWEWLSVREEAHWRYRGACMLRMGLPPRGALSSWRIGLNWGSAAGADGLECARATAWHSGTSSRGNERQGACARIWFQQHTVP